MVLNRLNSDRRHYAAYAFLWAFLLSAFIIVPIMIYDNGYFLHYGDFNVQQIPFYQLAHDSIRNSETGWSHMTDLGSNFVGSYSFYLLGSPFFWLTVPLPSSWVPYTLGPLLMLKLAFASLTAYIYLKRYVRHRKNAVIGGVLYAFSSFSVYNIFFFHFHEPMILFPLLLAAFDEFHSTGRKGLVALAVFACATVNYYFFVGQVVFVLIYYVIKTATKSYRFRLKDFLFLAAECILGFCMSMFLLLPSIAAITGNYRVKELINGWNAVIYPNTQRYIQILISMFFPGDVPAKNNFTASAGAKWSSVAAYLPMFSMTFVIADMRSRKRGLFGKLLIVLLITAMIPALNSSFQMLNRSYYARWFYMLTLIMIVITVQSLDNMKEVRFNRGFMPTAVITLAAAAVIGLMPEECDDGSWNIGLEQYIDDFWLFVIIAVFGLMLTYLAYLFYQKMPKYFFRATVILLSLFVVLYSELYLWTARSYADRDDDFMISYALNRGEEVTLSDIKDVRSDFYDTSDNIGMYWQVPNIQAFHSIVPGSLINFYNKVGVTRDVASRPSVSYYGLRSLLSVKYLFTEAKEDSSPPSKSELMPGYDYITTQNGFDIYENENYIPMGFTYDKFITVEEYSDLYENIRHLALLKAMVLTQEQMEEYADITGYTEGMYDALNASYNEDEPQNSYRPKYDGFDSITSGFRYEEECFCDDAEKLKLHSCSEFSYDKDGFTAAYNNTGNDDLLFFSIPYDDGWTAYVNGEETPIEEVNTGFMAVRVPGRTESDIVFRYHTPLLKEGCIISGSAAAVFILYLILNKGFGKKRESRRKYRIKKVKA